MVGLRTLDRSTMLILLLVLATVNSLFYPSVSRFQRAATGAFTPITVHLQPTSTTPYMATFRITKNPGTLSPWVLYPQSDKFDPSTQLGRNFTVPTPRAVIQGIAVAPDGAIWFTEAQAGKLGSLDPNTGNFTEYSPPIKVVAPIQLAVGLDGVVWFTDHGSNEFGSFNPKTGEWNKFPIGYCQGTYCSIGLPNAIDVDSTGEVWFSEHLPGRVARYDPKSRALTEYIIPAPPGASSIGLPYAWWAWPGPGNLVWFTSYGFGEVGYVNASVPVSLSISAMQEVA